jgi:hypothetical protein
MYRPNGEKSRAREDGFADFSFQKVVAARFERASERKKRADRHVENVPPQSFGSESNGEY